MRSAEPDAAMRDFGVDGYIRASRKQIFPLWREPFVFFELCGG
jgi:hypothetical protein